MIYIKIHYGLGNQMFQYALARRISLQRKTGFKLDISFYNKQKEGNNNLKRSYHLNVFNIVEEFASTEEIQVYSKSSFIQRQTNKFSSAFLPVQFHSFIREKNDQYDPRVNNCGNNVYLFGYWQDERYFKPAEDIIRNDFTFKSLPDQKNAEFMDLIRNNNSVSIHVRRTDYITDKNHNTNVGTCSSEYYELAINYIKERIKNLHFFVFSDDADWARKNLKIEAPVTYVIHNSIDHGYEDMRLMSNCRFHIISNSSFSWWSAWLSNFSDKIVIAPAIWQKIGNEKRILPKDWIRL